MRWLLRGTVLLFSWKEKQTKEEAIQIFTSEAWPCAIRFVVRSYMLALMQSSLTAAQMVTTPFQRISQNLKGPFWFSWESKPCKAHVTTNKAVFSLYQPLIYYV